MMFGSGKKSKLLVGILLVAIGSGLVFVGFEAAAYEKTIADREVTTNGDVTDTEVWQLPDGNWTYEFEYEYYFDQEEEILAQDGIAEHYPYDMESRQKYGQSEDGDKYESRGKARDSMEDHFNDDGSVTVYVDPYYPADGSLSDAESWLPRILQWAGTAILFTGLLGLSRLARKVSA